MQGYSLKDLEAWDERIKEKALEFGLSHFPQEFEICDQHQMLGYMAYTGMPSHYPHWSFGKAFERRKTLYDYGVIGLPYEMVINSNPSLAYLMSDNSLLLQILTIAHVYGHNDFFKNNLIFRYSHPEYTLEMFKAHSSRIRAYAEDPSIGLEKVEKILDAAHAISYQCNRHLDVKRKTHEEVKQRLMNDYQKGCREARERSASEPPPPDLYKFPLEPEDDILIFIRDNNPYLLDWQRDVLTVVADEACYFLPQIETKMLNEGWASYWHYHILNSLYLPQDLGIEFAIRHNQVLRPVSGELNPYHMGFSIFADIEKRLGRDKIFQVRETDRDVSFLRQYLTEELMREMSLFSHEQQGEDRVVSHVSDEEEWKVVRDDLLKSTGLASIPVIRILDANHRGQQTLHLWHEQDGRDLEISYAQQTVRHVYDLWGKPVVLESSLEGKPVFLICDGSGSNKFTRRLIG